jgi:hypothetical protein
VPTFTPTQGRYLAFIHSCTNLHAHPPSEAEIATAMCVSPPSVNQMIKNLEKRGLVSRQPGVPRPVQVLIPEDEIPSWRRGGVITAPAKSRRSRADDIAKPASPPVNLYVFDVYLLGGPLSDKFAGKEISRMIEIRGDQTLHDLHVAIFNAYDRSDDHLYEFQLGRRPHDPDGPTFGIPPSGKCRKKKPGDARAITLDELDLQPHRVFVYWFDFGDDWYHQVQLERIETAIPTVTYPRVIRRKGKSPPQYE